VATYIPPVEIRTKNYREVGIGLRDEVWIAAYIVTLDDRRDVPRDLRRDIPIEDAGRLVVLAIGVSHAEDVVAEALIDLGGPVGETLERGAVEDLDAVDLVRQGRARGAEGVEGLLDNVAHEVAVVMGKEKHLLVHGAPGSGYPLLDEMVHVETRKLVDEAFEPLGSQIAADTLSPGGEDVGPDDPVGLFADAPHDALEEPLSARRRLRVVLVRRLPRRVLEKLVTVEGRRTRWEEDARRPLLVDGRREEHVDSLEEICGLAHARLVEDHPEGDVRREEVRNLVEVGFGIGLRIDGVDAIDLVHRLEDETGLTRDVEDGSLAGGGVVEEEFARDRGAVFLENHEDVEDPVPLDRLLDGVRREPCREEDEDADAEDQDRDQGKGTLVEGKASHASILPWENHS
jgi:hypothetical protein